MLIGREGECARIDNLLEAAMQGRGGVLVLTGEVGSGRSRLLRYAAERASAFHVLSCNGLAGEAHLAFSGLFDLLRPVLGELASLPSRQAAAVTSALTLGPASAPRPDRFAVCMGVLSLVAHVARSRPLLLAVDDVHHLDEPTQDVLRFLARRIKAEGVAVLIAARVGESRFDRAEFPVLTVRGLLDAPSRTLLRSLSAGPIAPGIEDRLVTAAMGNPLALTEIARGLRPGQLAGIEPLDDPLPVGPRIADSFRSRILGLPPSTRLALLLLSTADTTDSWLINFALAARGLTRSDLEPAERVALISLGDDAIEFCHPLVSSVVHQHATHNERLEAHLVIAEAFEVAGMTERAVWHRAESIEGPDEGMAAILEFAALAARARAGHAASALALERSAFMSATDSNRARRLILAADEHQASGHQSRALELLARASNEATDVTAMASIEYRRGHLRMLGGEVGEAIEGLSSAARRIEGRDQTRAAQMLTDVGLALLLSRGIDAARDTADRAVELAQGAPEHVVLAAQLLVARLLASTGHPVDELPMPSRWRPWLKHDEALPGAHRLEYVGAWFLWYLGAAPSAVILDDAVADARATGTLGTLPFLLASRGDIRLRSGRWQDAGADLAECLHLADETCQPGISAYANATLARLEAGRGREASTIEIGGRAVAGANALGLASLQPYVQSALGLLELGLRRFPRAIARLEEAERSAAAIGWTEPTAFGAVADLVEAYVRVGRLKDARRVTDRLRETATSGHPWTCGALARCDGLLETTPAFEAILRGAIELHGRAIAPFEVGRDRLILGQRLLRAGRRAEARMELGHAQSVFDRVGAIAWSETARSELITAGAPASLARAPEIDRLTAHELQVALLVAQGATNREAASALFVSPKTIEYHLGNIYGKLAIRSRVELAHHVIREGPPH
jgi:DNA-binding CsgD family transcriptional regulator